MSGEWDLESYISVLDPRFPIALSMPETFFWDLLALRPDRPCARGVEARANAQRLQGVQERFVASQPRFIPERAHEDTAADLGLPAGWYRDSFAGRDETATGQVRPEDTDQFILTYETAERRETPPCTCGHERDAHQHHRRGTDCALCGCARWRPRRWWRVLGHRRAIRGDQDA